MSGENWGGQLNVKNIDYDYRDLGRLLDPKHADNPPKWGCLIHPDEIRQVMAVGNGKFITTGGDQLQDYQLKNWIDLSIRSFGDQMQWDIYPKLWRHTPMPSDDPNRIIEEYAQIESAYDYRPSEANYFFLKLRHKPLHKLHKWELAYPFTGRHYLDLLPKAVPQYNLGILRAVFVQVPWSNAVPVQIGINAWRGLMQGGNFLPAAYLVDYTTGYSHASRVPAELKEILQDYITINIMSAFGDGIVGGMANYSTTIGILSESIGTTMSATSAYFGARIMQLGEKIKAWWKARKSAYGGTTINFL